MAAASRKVPARAVATRRRPHGGGAPAARAGALLQPLPPGDLERWGVRVLLAVIVLLGVFVRLRLAGVPLERDEGEYAYAGQLILQGTPPYTAAYNMKFPGIYYAYSLILALFGSTTHGIHLGLLVVNVASAALLFLIARRLSGEFAAAMAAGCFVLLGTGATILGPFAHATHFVVLPVLGAFLLLLDRGAETGMLRLVCAGVLLGVAVLMKQHAVFYLPFAASWALLRHGSRHGPIEDGARAKREGPAARGVSRLSTSAASVGLLALGALLPFLIVCLLFLWQGVLARFWFWTFGYAWQYVTQVPIVAALPLFLRGLNRVTSTNRPLWLLCAAGLGALWLTRRSGSERAFVLGLLASSLLAMAPGFYFREHYFILLLPVASLLGGIAIDAVRQGLVRRVPSPGSAAVAAAMFTIVAGTCLYQERSFLFSLDERAASRTIYGPNPFPESVEIARYIREHSAPQDRIAILGSEPQIYFYAERMSATGFIYTYPLMEKQKYAATMQQDMIREIEEAHPKFLVIVRIATSWLVQPGSDRTILDWGMRYAQECFEPVGVVDIVSAAETRYVWEDQARTYRPVSSHAIFLHRRKTDGVPCRVASRP